MYLFIILLNSRHFDDKRSAQICEMFKLGYKFTVNDLTIKTIPYSFLVIILAFSNQHNVIEMSIHLFLYNTLFKFLEVSLVYPLCLL